MRTFTTGMGRTVKGGLDAVASSPALCVVTRGNVPEGDPEEQPVWATIARAQAPAKNGMRIIFLQQKVMSPIISAATAARRSDAGHPLPGSGVPTARLP